MRIDLLDRWQRGFPLVSRPYAVISADVGLEEGTLLAELAALQVTGVISRIGATLRPNTAGASLLAAMRVPGERLNAVAEIVNAEQGVNHNYEREHDLNLWFVMTGADRQATGAALERIRDASGLDVIELPLVRSYYIDLGFSLADGRRKAKPVTEQGVAMQPCLSTADRHLLRLIEPGLPLVSEPYAHIARELGMDEGEVIGRLQALIGQGVITRFGVIVRHRALGFSANAMAVWDVPDETVDVVGARLAMEPGVTLCYRRPRWLPVWRYNLFCMVHGRERAAVEAEVRG